MSRNWQEETEKRRKTGKKAGTDFRGFVTHSLSREDKRHYLQYEQTEDFEGDLLFRLVGEGYRLSLSIDDRNGAYMAAISTKDGGSVNRGLVLTARSGASPSQAGLRAVFMHYVIFEERWPDPSVEAEYEDEWALAED